MGLVRDSRFRPVTAPGSAFDPVDSRRWAELHQEEAAAAEHWLAAMLGDQRATRSLTMNRPPT